MSKEELRHVDRIRLGKLILEDFANIHEGNRQQRLQEIATRRGIPMSQIYLLENTVFLFLTHMERFMNTENDSIKMFLENWRKMDENKLKMKELFIPEQVGGIPDE